MSPKKLINFTGFIEILYSISKLAQGIEETNSEIKFKKFIDKFIMP